MGIIPRAKREEQRPIRSRTPEKICSERLRLVMDDEPASLGDNSLEDGEKMFVPEENLEASTSPPHEPGIDLAKWSPKDIDTGRLAAFVKDTRPAKGDRKTTPETTRKAIVMPMAKTDLREIFHADNICMVARPDKNEKKPGENVTVEALVKEIPPLAAKTSAPPPKQSFQLDSTEQYLVENWPKLPPNVQKAILHVIEVAISPDDE